jgi:hypothetical protein
LKLRTLIIAAILLTVLGANANAIVFGIRYSDIREQRLPPLVDGGSKGRFGFYAGVAQNNSSFLIGAEYDRNKTERGDSLLYFRRMTVNIGYRYNLFTADKGRAMNFMPFAAIHYFKSYSKVEADSNIMSSTEAKFTRDMLNDYGGWISFGAEYYFAPVASLGAEAGFRYTKAKSSALGYDVKYSDYSTFAAILLNYYW